MRARALTAPSTPNAKPRSGGKPTVDSGFRLVLEHLAATVEAVRADVVAQVGFAGGRLDSDARHGQGVVRTVHAALGRRLLVLLDGHVGLLKSVGSWGAPDPGYRTVTS